MFPPLPAPLAVLLLSLAGATIPIEASAGVEPPPRDVLREEHFVLELCARSTADTLSFLRARDDAAECVGVLAYRRKQDAVGQRVEWELSFFAEETRVLHVERLEGAGSKLVWREVRSGEGRTLVAHFDADARGLKLLEFSGVRQLRERIDAPEGAVLPLYLLELVRAGDVENGRFSLFDPLSRLLEPVDVRACYGAAESPPVASPDGAAPNHLVQRLVELRRDDATLAGAYLFSGDELVAFQWQGGALRARRVSASEYARQRERSTSPPVAD